MGYKSLIINPGSTSTKIGVFEDETLLFEETLRHATEEIAKYDSIVAQKDFRKEIITNLLKEKNFDKRNYRSFRIRNNFEPYGFIRNCCRFLYDDNYGNVTNSRHVPKSAFSYRSSDFSGNLHSDFQKNFLRQWQDQLGSHIGRNNLEFFDLSFCHHNELSVLYDVLF